MITEIELKKEMENNLHIIAPNFIFDLKRSNNDNSWWDDWIWK